MMIVGCFAIAAEPGVAQPPDAFQSAPGPVAPKPKPRTPLPPPVAEPTAVAPIPNPPFAPAPGQLRAGTFDGTYTGTVTNATKAAGGRHRNCAPGGVVRMIITSGAVLIQQGGRPDGGTANYRGTVDAGGAVSASATNPEGIVHTVAGKISQARFTGEIRRTNCNFSVDLVKG